MLQTAQQVGSKRMHLKMGGVTTPTLIVMLASTASFVPDVTSTTVRAELTSVTSPTPAHNRVLC